MPVIEAHNLSKRFGQRLAVDGLSLKVEEGEVLVVLPVFAMAAIRVTGAVWFGPL